MSKARLILPALGLTAGLGAGVAGAVFLKESPVTDEATGEATQAEEPVADLGPTDFAELNNQFVVPVVKDGSVRALVVLSITLEVAQGGSQAVFSIEPRLRDAFLQVLFEHSNMGGFDDNFIQNERMSLLRQGLREAASKLLGTEARDVLIVDIVRQEV